jgi:hypothetical protein
MKAYVVFEEDKSNPRVEGLQQYIQQAPAILKQYTPLISLCRQASNSRVIVRTHGIKWPSLPA